MTGDGGQRAEIVERIRAAQGYPAARRDEATPVSSAVPSVSGTTPELCAAFCAGCHAAQGVVHLAADAGAARHVVAAVLESAAVSTALVSPDAAGAPWNLEPHLRSRGIDVVTGRERLQERAAGEPAWQPRRRDEAFGADAGVCVASHGLADTGTIVLCSSAANHRLDSLTPRLNVVMLDASLVLPGLGELCQRLSQQRTLEESSAVTFVRGPSRTADIELTLTIGVHGPQQLHVVLVGG